MNIPALALLTLTATAAPPPTVELPSLVDYRSFVLLSGELETLRSERLLGTEEFLAAAKEPGVVLLDTRSRAAYDRMHLRGAVHLNFSDFTEEKLAKVIPTKDTKILIYCNNNVARAPEAFPAKLIVLALNIPTFINLHGYGYTNAWELSSLVDVDDPRLEWEGTAVADSAD